MIKLIARLRATGSDCDNVEVKSAAGGLPRSTASTPHANDPGGATVILGLDEATGFRPVRLPDPRALKQGSP
ncbi:hypothetical protein ACQP2T_17035 [Nonomuraea sp. CA-143628]|uniref:hypothetical protein n=1 Tax=Nonomuraea sp. CA-143628 TaxID=3239997 RepID=UPI003D93538A